MKTKYIKIEAAILSFLISISLLSSIGISFENPSIGNLPDIVPYPIPTKTSTSIIKSDTYGITIENLININDLDRKVINIYGKDFDQLSILDYISTKECCKPQIPIKEVLIAIPDDVTIQCSVLEKHYKKMSHYLVYPVPTEIESISKDGFTYIDEEFCIDDGFYAKNIYYPQDLVKIDGIFNIRDQRVLRLHIQPFQYNPTNQILQVYYSLKIQLKYNTPTSLKLKDVGPYNDICKRQILNYNKESANQKSQIPGNVIYPRNLDDVNNSADYLILTSSPFYIPARLDFVYHTRNNSLNDLALWRAEYNCFDVAVVNIDDYFIGGNNDTKIKNFIEYVYNNWSAPHMSDGHVGYVLLVGDTENVTSHFDKDYKNRTYVSDRWLVSIDEDSIPDIMIGRFCVDDYDELNITSNKTVQYEQNSILGQWHNNILMCEGSEGPFNDYNFVKEVLIEYGGFNVSEVIKPRGGTAEDIKNKIDNGTLILNYCGHGSSIGWQIFHRTDIFDLNNGQMLPLVYSLACSTGYFEGPMDCLGEEFVNTDQKGAIAFWGASKVTSGGAFSFGKYLFESIFEDFDYILGKIIMNGIMKIPYLPEFNLLGDPALDISGKTGFYQTPDLTSSHLNLSIAPEHPTNEDGNVVISADILNIGDATATNFSVQFLETNPFGIEKSIGEQKIDSIEPGEYYTLTQNWNVTNAIGKKSIIIQIDYYNNVTESFELNNQAGMKVGTFYRDYIYVDDENTNGPWNGTIDYPYQHIQDGIDCVSENGTVYVNEGLYINPDIYKDQILINKRINLLGENKENTIVDSGGIANCIITEGNVNQLNISGFTFQNGTTGMELEGDYYLNITDNIIKDFNTGIHIIGGNHNKILKNKIYNCQNGTLFQKTDENYIDQNNIYNNQIGILQHYGNRNLYKRNIIKNNNETGIFFDITADDNDIYQNHFINNTIQAFDNCSNNWDNGYPNGGNYWDDFDEQIEGAFDDYRGEQQDHIGSDNISDLGRMQGGGINPYMVDGYGSNNQDTYPWIIPIDVISPIVYFEQINRSIIVNYGDEIGKSGDERLDVNVFDIGSNGFELNVTLYVKGLDEDNWTLIKPMPYIRQLHRGAINKTELMNYYDAGYNILQYKISARDLMDNMGKRPDKFEASQQLFTITILPP